MTHVLDNGIERGTPFTLRQFVAAGAERLKMRVVVGGRGLEHQVLEPMTNRPGLALTGFYGHFAWARLQLIGLAENAYLESLSEAERVERFKAMIERRAYCFIFACGIEVPPYIRALAEQTGVAVFGTRLITRDFAHLCAFVLEELRAPKTRVYGTTVEVAGIGVMMEGDPGLGKSETALGLVKRGNALVADDLTCLRKDIATGTIYASACESTRNYMEIRGIGIIHVPSVFGVTAVCRERKLDLVITFKRLQDVIGQIDRAGEERVWRTFFGVNVPQLVIPVSAGRDLVNLVETAAQHFKLRAAGHDAVRDLDERLKSRAIARKA